jgi:hypothetical protein
MHAIDVSSLVRLQARELHDFVLSCCQHKTCARIHTGDVVEEWLALFYCAQDYANNGASVALSLRHSLLHCPLLFLCTSLF